MLAVGGGGQRRRRRSSNVAFNPESAKPFVFFGSAEVTENQCDDDPADAADAIGGRCSAAKRGRTSNRERSGFSLRRWQRDILRGGLPPPPPPRDRRHWPSHSICLLRRQISRGSFTNHSGREQQQQQQQQRTPPPPPRQRRFRSGQRLSSFRDYYYQPTTTSKAEEEKHGHGSAMDLFNVTQPLSK